MKESHGEFRNQEKKLCIVFDTNKIFNSIDFHKPNTINGELERIYNLRNELNLTEVIDLVLPDIALEELKKQYIEEYKTKKDNLDNIFKNKELPGISLDVNKDFNIEEYVTQKMKDIRSYLFEDYNILINMDMKKASLISLLERALEKNPPFEGKNKNSDKGFKDAVLWENILSYKTERPLYDMVLFTSDKRFNENSLKNEYQQRFNETINIFNDIEDLTMHISSITEQISTGLIKEIKETKHVRESILRNLENLQDQYKEWLEDREAYGEGIEIFKILNLNTTNIVPANLSNYSVDGDYFALIEIQAEGAHNGTPEIFRSKLYVDISLNKNSEVSLNLTGITLSKED